MRRIGLPSGFCVTNMEEQPGPPLNHVAKGAVVGLLRASKNLNVLVYSSIIQEATFSPEEHVQPRTDIEVATVLVDTWGCFTHSAVGDEVELGAR